MKTWVHAYQLCEKNSSPKSVQYTRPDRLSDLTDVLLIKILSSLTAREVAQTCILSKRWQNLWASVPCLHFDLAEFSSQFSAESYHKFKKFVTGFLHSFDEAAYIDVFHLRCHGHTSVDNGIRDAARMWIAQAVKHRLKKLHLDMSFYNSPTLPNSLYICDSLEELCLSMDDGMHVSSIAPKAVYLPKLKRLHLHCIFISADDIEKILYGCPMLESLSVEACLLETYGARKHFSMRYCYVDQYQDLISF